ncbi:flagellar hook-basal body complex protein [Caminibacter mediatlanticus]|uniref:Flagellar hook protein FlgE n=1 Tax=Caminibacter mediatlanticus TB-2 TaxID=391592 RepID=A0AAI9F1X8_9BACT|nr:flagellar hook-basal body complex protein [Caminibacter mediatlanticus]EDM23016.1 flagellar hook protein E [Caminibacter mediatlanticus TB-2]
MMRSLWSGVSGLNAHQIAMDVEANNIANVNTVGFKYSRTNFQNLLSQTIKSATAPQGDLGGKNSLQVGLGATVSSVETMFKQGSIQNTDKNTDMAINGDGFFVVSSDGGKTYRYTRAGDFTFDAQGNFVDPNGYIVQGWLADPDTHNIDTATGLKPISIPPGLTTPANPTSKISIKANLNSGDHIIEKGAARPTVDQTADMNGLYDANGNKIALTPDVDSIQLAIDVNNDGTIDTNTEVFTFKYGTSNSDNDGKFTTIKDLLDEINSKISQSIQGPDSYKYKVFLNGNGQIVDPHNLIKIQDSTHTFLSSTNNILEDVFKSLQGPSTTTASIKAIQNSFIGADDVGELFNANGDAFNLQDGQGISVNISGLGETRKFVYTSQPISAATEGCGTTGGKYQPDKPIVADSNEGFHWLFYSDASSDSNNRASLNVNQQLSFVLSNGDTLTYTYGKDFQTINDLCCLLNTDLANRNLNDIISFENGKIVESLPSVITDAQVKDSNGVVIPADTTTTLGRLAKIMDGLDGNGGETQEFYKNDTYYFHDIQDLAFIWQLAVDASGDPLNSTTGNSGIVSISQNGELQVKNTSPNSFNINIAGYPSDEQDNQLFTDTFSPINGTVAAGGTAFTQSMNAAVHTTSMDIFDSLGAKHTLTFHFRKTHTSTGPNDPTVWKWYAEVPEPSTLDQPAYGYVKFNSDGSINSYNPPSLIFNPNNGAEPGQAVQLNFGEMGKFDGLTSFEAPSSTSGQTQDGYPGGDLQQLVVDQTGTIIGVFTNGRSYSLAQVAIAKFVNNEGLMNEGGTLFSASPNSGDPIVGTAGTGGRGSIQPSALEMSNVDLSRSLTQLIVIQRGFQANSKTITTSDQMLNTLLQLKQ